MVNSSDRSVCLPHGSDPMNYAHLSRFIRYLRVFMTGVRLFRDQGRSAIPHHEWRQGFQSTARFRPLE